VLPTARVNLEVLLGPGGEIDNIAVQVEDPTGRLLALRRWPIGVKDSATERLNEAWRAMLNALPNEAFDVHYRRSVNKNRNENAK